MGWEGVTIMNQRVRFIAEYLNEYFPVNELCLQFNISRKTGYKGEHRGQILSLMSSPKLSFFSFFIIHHDMVLYPYIQHVR
ncbi:MAG: hypothetical protein NT010_11730 [Proteobacteria bacterium]|nr:hypothetical protein [Pseudomonadota bacterium]